jgi:hypothetical protein
MLNEDGGLQEMFEDTKGGRATRTPLNSTGAWGQDTVYPYGANMEAWLTLE